MRLAGLQQRIARLQAALQAEQDANSWAINELAQIVKEALDDVDEEWSPAIEQPDWVVVHSDKPIADLEVGDTVTVEKASGCRF